VRLDVEIDAVEALCRVPIAFAFRKAIPCAAVPSLPSMA
jgi:hypothetical protein